MPGHLTVIDSSLPVIAGAVSAKPPIRVESGAFVSRFGDQQYELGSTKAWVAPGDSQLRRTIQAEVA
jgi:hypothetical protein